MRFPRQEWTPEWVAISFSRGSSQTKDWTHVSCIGRWILYHWVTGKPIIIANFYAYEMEILGFITALMQSYPIHSYRGCRGSKSFPNTCYTFLSESQKFQETLLSHNNSACSTQRYSYSLMWLWSFFLIMASNSSTPLQQLLNGKENHGLAKKEL